MAPRLNKRQKRELDELSVLANQSNDGPLSTDDEAPVNAAAPGFSALFIPEDDSPDEDSLASAKIRKSKKKKKKLAEDADSPGPSVSPAAAKPTPHVLQGKNEKKAIKKAKAKERKAGYEELNQALAELSVQYPELQSNSPERSKLSTQNNNTLSALLSVSLSHLDSEAELRKFFGSKVVAASKTTAAGSSSASPRRKPATQRSYLAHAQPSSWGSRLHEGLSIAPLSQDQLEDKLERHSWDPIEDEKWWTVEYSKKYKNATLSFMKIVASGDPDGFWNLLGKLPGHADTLLQLSEVYRYREEYTQAATFVERALFTYEGSFLGAFTFTTGLNRLDFDRVENRPFFLAIHRQVTDLQRRGCIRTAFEFSRLLYSLDPWNDPYGALFHLEYLAIKVGMTQWLLHIFDYFTGLRESGQSRKARIDPSLLPGWLYSRALAMRIDEDNGNDKGKSHENSTAALKEAILSFPSVVPLLADRLEISPSSHPSFRIETSAGSLTTQGAALHLLSHLYAQRSFSLWKDPVHCAWFANTITNVCASSPSAFPQHTRRLSFLELYTLPNPRYSLYRHIIVLDESYRRLSAFIPTEVVEPKMLNCDPLPPPTCVSRYDEEFFNGAEDLFSVNQRTRRELEADQRLLERLLPNPLFREQLQAFFDANPQFAQRFPGGMVQFALLAEHLPEDMVGEFMLAEVEAGGEMDGLGNGGMPGQMPEEDMVAVNFGDDETNQVLIVGTPPAEENILLPITDGDQDGEISDEEEDEDVAPFPFRVMRNIVNRFLGRDNNADTDDSSGEGENDGGIFDEAGVD